MVTRHSGGDDSARPAAYRHVEPPAFAGQWNWTDTSGQAQPQVTLFSDLYRACCSIAGHNADSLHIASGDSSYTPYIAQTCSDP